MKIIENFLNFYLLNKNFNYKFYFTVKFPSYSTVLPIYIFAFNFIKHRINKNLKQIINFKFSYYFNNLNIFFKRLYKFSVLKRIIVSHFFFFVLLF
jgi:hypothetical protein